MFACFATTDMKTHSLRQTETERVSLGSEPSCPHPRMAASSQSHDTLRCVGPAFGFSVYVCVPICTSPHRSARMLGWPKVCVFHTDLWKNSNKLFGQPNNSNAARFQLKTLSLLLCNLEAEYSFSYGLHKGNSLSEVLKGGVNFTDGSLSAKHFFVFQCSCITPTTANRGFSPLAFCRTTLGTALAHSHLCLTSSPSPLPCTLTIRLRHFLNVQIQQKWSLPTKQFLCQ